MKRSYWWWALPFGVAGLVLLVAPPVSLNDAERKPLKIDIRTAKPESIDLPNYTPRPESTAPAEGESARPAAPRTREEVVQVRAALKEREKKLLNRRKGMDPNNRAAAQALIDEIVRYNEDVRAFEAAWAKLE